MSRARLLGRAGANLVTLPPTVLHELAHLLVVLPWAAQVGVVFDMTRADAELRVNYRSGTPQGAVVASHYAPAVSGVAIAVVAVWWLLTQGLAPATATEAVWWSVLSVWWAIYTLPSGRDRDTEVSSQ